MNSSEKINELATAMAKFQAEVKPALKGSTNPYFKSKYADLQSCWDAAREALTKNGLSVIQGGPPYLVLPANNGEVVTVCTRLLHSSGQWIESSLTMKPAKADPQGIGSAVTYARRYALAAILGLVADEDDDGNAATHAEAKNSLPAGAVAVPKLITQDQFNTLKLADPSLVDRILKKYGAVSIDELTADQAAKGLAFIASETAKKEAAKAAQSKDPF